MQEVVQALPTLVSLLKSDPNKQDAEQLSREASMLDDFAIQFSSTYDFVGASSPASADLTGFFNALVTHRLQPSSWRAVLQPGHRMQVLQCVRLMTRDAVLRRKLVDMDAVKDIAVIFQQEADAHCSGVVTPFQVETLSEATSIIKRLAAEAWGLLACVACGLHHTLTLLLSSTDPSILPLVLVCLIGFAAHKEHAGLITHTAALDLLCRIVHQYDLLFKRLAADLLALLARREEVIAELLAMNGLGRLVGQLPSGDPALTQSLLRVVCYLASDSAALTEIYQTGTIPVLLSLIASALKDWPSPGSNPALTSSKVIDMQLVCTALTRIAEDNELAYNIRQCNGITLLGKLLLLPGTSHGPQSDSGDKASTEMASLRAYAFRALRFLFSMERNRKVFKRLFPPDLFAAFIDLGHYNASLGAYSSLVMRLGDLSDKQRSALAAALDDVSADREGAEVVRTVRGGQYALIEMLGKGGYGAVWKARRSRGEQLVALKEIPLSDVAVFGATDAERLAGLGRMGKEVEILSSLSHPHIVQYYESFVDGPYLYISMELVEGVSLLDHLTSLAEKGRRMPEQDIWQVLIAVCLALHYIHCEKQVVHRDLTPANIVLGQGPDGLRHSKIADFGLAKRLGGAGAPPGLQHSVVGTMPYTCPEIIQQEHYSEKADVWSLGCVLYHCMMLHPPFDGTNPLSVASKIVEGSYEQVSDPPEGPSYSMHLKQLQRLLMTIDPARRPSIEEVGSVIAGQLMTALEKLTANEQRLVRALALERTHSRRGLVSAGSVLEALPGGAAAVASPMAACHNPFFATARINTIPNSNTTPHCHHLHHQHGPTPSNLGPLASHAPHVSLPANQPNQLNQPSQPLQPTALGPRAPLPASGSSLLPGAPTFPPLKTTTLPAPRRQLLVPLTGSGAMQAQGGGPPSPSSSPLAPPSLHLSSGPPPSFASSATPSATLGLGGGGVGSGQPSLPGPGSAALREGGGTSGPAAAAAAGPGLGGSQVAPGSSQGRGVAAEGCVRGPGAPSIESPHDAPGEGGGGLPGLPGPQGQGQGQGQGSTLQTVPGARTVSLATSRLKPVADPLTLILAQLHKVMWVEQLPPGLARDQRRRCMEVFRRQLFGPGSSPATLKSHLARLLSCDADIIREATSPSPAALGGTGGGPGSGGPMGPLGRPVDFGLGGSAAGQAQGQGQGLDGCLTYDQLHQLLESLLVEKGYYPVQPGMHTLAIGAPMGGPLGPGSGPGVAAAGGSPEGEQLRDQLPPTRFAGQQQV